MIVEVSSSMRRFANVPFRIKNHLLLLNPPNKSNLDISRIPVIINNFNRLDCLLKLLKWLEGAGMKNVFIIDNCSTYKPLLSFYQETDHVIFSLDKNIGFLALWKSVIYERFKSSYYIYTDPDIVPTETCPLDAILVFYKLLKKYPLVDKVGFGLVIDDLPEYYPLKDKVINWERKFWNTEREKNVYEASIDTTFALYRPRAKGGSELNALRTGGEYVAKHLPWYLNPCEMSEEEKYYNLHAGNSSSWNLELLGKERNLKY